MPRRPSSARRRVLLERAEPVREVAELAETRIIRHHDQARGRLEHARRTGERRRHDGRAGMGGRRLVAIRRRELRHVRERTGEDARVVLVGGAEGVGAPVRAGEREPLALQAADALHRPEAAGGLLEIEEGIATGVAQTSR